MTEERQQPDKRQEDKGFGDDGAFTVAGIGASAGGLEALELFFRKVKQDCGMVFVVIQHRGRESKEVMVNLMEKYSSLPVKEIANGMALEPGCVYINPPHVDIAVEDGAFRTRESEGGYEARLPIDHCFRSLARSYGERSICIILSGTGSDGTLGLKEVKLAGGLTIVQDEEQAKYAAMPRHAIETGQVDLVLRVEEMPGELERYTQQTYLKEPEKAPTETEDSEEILQRIFQKVRNVTGHDFSKYKRKTICRRIERRMAVSQLSDIKGYLGMLEESRGEVHALFKDMIITVTNFFRDAEAFEALKEKVLKDLIHNNPLTSPIRIWVPGCATGEEAYSIAILCEEAMEEAGKRHDLQIFATDVDEDSIERARYGQYPRNIEADVSRERLEQYFTKTENSYKIKERVREKLVFAAQDMIKDPPFSRLDLLCCRNVLIYMDSELQKKVIPLFQYTLKPHGYLFLGTSETIGSFSNLFSIVDNKWKIFQKKPQSIRYHDHPTIPVRVDAEKEERPEDKRREETAKPTINQAVEKLILREYSLPCVLINDKHQILYFNGDTSAFLNQPGGEPTMNILQLVKTEHHYTLSMLIHKAEQEDRTIRSDPLRLKENDKTLSYQIVVRPVKEPRIRDRLFMVIFDVKSMRELEVEKDNQKEDDTEPRVKALEQELTSTKEYLQTTIEELETSNEELKSSNEELQSTNEELQSTNEELETSREELQSTNEELQTINRGYQSKINELAKANDDLDKLLSNVDMAIIFLDTRLKIVKFNPASKYLFNFIKSDTGRHVDNITNNLEYNYLVEDAQMVLDTLSKAEREVKTTEGRWLRLRIAPYRTNENVIDGLIITAYDITVEKDGQHYAESIVDTVRQPLMVLDSELRVVSANKAFYRVFEMKAEGTEGKRIFELGKRQWDIPKLRELLEEVLPKKTNFEDFKVQHVCEQKGQTEMILNARQIVLHGKATELILLAIELID